MKVAPCSWVRGVSVLPERPSFSDASCVVRSSSCAVAGSASGRTPSGRDMPRLLAHRPHRTDKVNSSGGHAALRRHAVPLGSSSRRGSCSSTSPTRITVRSYRDLPGWQCGHASARIMQCSSMVAGSIPALVTILVARPFSHRRGRPHRPHSTISSSGSYPFLGRRGASDCRDTLVPVIRCMMHSRSGVVSRLLSGGGIPSLTLLTQRSTVHMPPLPWVRRRFSSFLGGYASCFPEGAVPAETAPIQQAPCVTLTSQTSLPPAALPRGGKTAAHDAVLSGGWLCRSPLLVNSLTTTITAAPAQSNAFLPK